MAVVVGIPCLGQTGDVSSRNTLGKQGFGKTDGKCPAVVAAAGTSRAVVCIAHIALAWCKTVGAVMSYIVVNPIKQILYPAYIVSISGYTVRL